jgi:hypothetical protein
MWHETIQQHDGTISRRPVGDNGFISSPEDWVLSGPHFFLANPSTRPRSVSAKPTAPTTTLTSKPSRTTICRVPITDRWRIAPNTPAVPRP